MLISDRQLLKRKKQTIVPAAGVRHSTTDCPSCLRSAAEQVRRRGGGRIWRQTSTGTELSSITVNPTELTSFGPAVPLCQYVDSEGIKHLTFDVFVGIPEFFEFFLAYGLHDRTCEVCTGHFQTCCSFPGRGLCFQWILGQNAKRGNL